MPLGPTALNTSPLRLLRVTSTQARERPREPPRRGNRERTLTAPLTLVVAADTDFHAHMDRLVPHWPGAAEHFTDEAVRAAMARDNAFLQTGCHLIVALRASGLEVGPMGIADPAGLDADLLAGTSWRSLLVVNAGWPAADNGATRAPAARGRARSSAPREQAPRRPVPSGAGGPSLSAHRAARVAS